MTFITIITILVILASQVVCAFIGYLKTKSSVAGAVVDIAFVIGILFFINYLISIEEIYLSLLSVFFLIDARINMYNIERDLR